MYEAEQDAYCYVGTSVLKNKAGLRDQDELNDFETAMTFARAEEPLPVGRLFLALVADQAGHPLDLDQLNPDSMLTAMIASFNADEEPLTAVIRQLIA